MTLLEICQQIAESIGLPAPPTIIGNSNQDAIRLKAAVNEAGQYLYKKNWPELSPEVTLSTSAGQADYALPSDFRGFVTDTAWNTTNKRPAGIQTPQRYANITHGLANVAVYDEIYIQASGSAGQLYISPTPSGVEVFVYRYKRNVWISGSGGTAFSLWGTSAGDSAAVLFDSHALYLEAKWRFLRALAQPFALERQEAMDYCDTAVAEANGLAILYANQRGKFDPWVAITPETSVGL